MAEANQRLQQTPTEAQARTMNAAIVTLSLRSAKEAVKLKLRCPCRKPNTIGLRQRIG
jgi:hypothetical protein